MSTAATAQSRVLDEAGGIRAMTWVIGIMLFLTVLATALGLGTLGARTMLARQLAGRLTVQLVTGDAASRDRDAARVVTTLRGLPQVTQATAVSRAELARLLRPWLGSDGADPELPMPAMIDVDLVAGTDPAVVERTVARIAPAARIDRHESWMSPVTGFMTTLSLLSAALVLLMAGATAAVVVLAARAGLERHRATIEVMHILGSTDRQIARLFQRRIALDAALGGAVGGVAALTVVAFVGHRLGAVGSDLLGGIGLSLADWVLLGVLPVGFVVLATLAARYAVLAALRRAL